MIGKGAGFADPLHYLPLPEGATRAVIVTPGRGGGRPGGLRDLETGQVASRAVLHGGSGDSGGHGGSGDSGGHGGSGTVAALADQGALETMAELETWPLFFLVGQGVPWPWLCARPPRQRL